MPQNAPRPKVEEVYHAYRGKVGGVGRLRRTFSLRGLIDLLAELQRDMEEAVIMDCSRGIPETKP
jgi:hypothetical protein